MTYRGELIRAMDMLAKDERAIFLGQGVGAAGTFMSTTLSQIAPAKRIELPVAEEMQMGMSLGLALDGFVPVSIYPRWNFLLLAANQLVNHVDKMGLPVIVRVGVGSEKPLHPGSQHVGDFTEGFRVMLEKTPVVRLMHADIVMPAYEAALQRTGPTVIVEFADLYE